MSKDELIEELYRAFEEGRLEDVQDLLGKGVDPSAKSECKTRSKSVTGSGAKL